MVAELVPEMRRLIAVAVAGLLIALEQLELLAEITRGADNEDHGRGPLESAPATSRTAVLTSPDSCSTGSR